MSAPRIHLDELDDYTIERAAGDDNGHAGPAPRFRLYTAEDLAHLPPPAWLLDQHLPEGSLAVLYGPPGVGKSFLGLAWALSIATDTPWLRWPTRGGLVLYVAAEGGAGLAQRVQVYRDAHELTGNVDKVRFVREPVNLLADGDVDGLLASWAILELVRTPALVVLDTLSRCMPGGDENSAQDVGRVIAASDRIRRATDAAVVLVHHTGKDGLQERGSSALRGAADTMFSLKAEDGVLTLECTKQKDAAPIGAQQLRLLPIGGSCVLEPSDGAAATTGGLTDSERKALQALAGIAIADRGATSSEWEATAVGTDGRKADRSQIGRGTYFRSRKRLVELGLVTWDRSSKRYSLTGMGLSASVPRPNEVP